MKCILSAAILVLLINDSQADRQNDLITTYDPGETTSESPKLSPLPKYGEITANKYPGVRNVRFERSIKFEDDQKEQGLIDNDIADPSSFLEDDSFAAEEALNQNDFNLKTGYKIESKSKIKFEGNNDGQDYSEEQEGNEKDDDFETSASRVVFKDDRKANGDDSDYSDTEKESSGKPIKFEDHDNEPYSNNRDRDRNTGTEQVVFKDEHNRNTQSFKTQKRKPRRRPGFESQQSKPAPLAPNSPYAGSGYPSQPGVGYPRPGYPSPGDPNTGYASIPKPGYQSYGYAYPYYHSPYPGTAFQNPAYPGYPPYPSPNAPINPGHGAYPSYPPAGPTANPGPGQGDPTGYKDTRYPGQEYAGYPSAVAAQPPTALQGSQAGPANPSPEYPYYQNYPVSGYPSPYPALNSQYPPQNQALYRPPAYPGPGYQTGYPRPSRRPKSLTQRAVSAVAEALTSIALYDDQQCVPRILCEVAGGSTAVSSPTLLKASASLQPLLSLLQAYNGVSSSPLFIFGHAAVTGMTAKDNPTACYRAYPKCPREPEKLINYLNNHNGGFFRFFGQPETTPQQHNLEQFYDYLSGQNGLPQQPQQQNYGFLKPNGYGFLPQYPYANSYNYGYNYYNEQTGYRNAKDGDSEVEGRIQNKPIEGVNAIDAESDLDSNESQDTGSKWSFPEGESNKKGKRQKVKKFRPLQSNIQQEQDIPNRGSKTLKFPDERADDRGETQINRDYPKTGRRIFFPQQNYFQITKNYQTTTSINSEEYYFDHKHNFYVKRPKPLQTDDVVYVVRGNGDPNHPEVVRVRPGQSI